VAKARQIHASCRAGQPVAGFASSASTIRQTERAQHRLIGTFANGVVIGRKANGESRFKHHGKVRSRFDGFQVDMLGHASILAD
jgi:hypothetical protein